MFKHVVVPLDGSTLAESVLPVAASLATKLKAKVTLLHAIELNAPDEVHKERHLTEAGQAESYLQAIAKENFGRLKVDVHVHTAEVKDVAGSLASHAKELKADLIVMCTHGHSGLRQIIFGNIAQRVIAQGKTPVLLLRPDDSPHPRKFELRKIMLPLDDESTHDEVFPYAKTLAKAYKSEIILVTVIPTFGTLTGEEAIPSSLLPATTKAILDLKEQAAAGHLKAHEGELRKAGLPASAFVVRGDSATEIVKASEELKANLILLATHRKTGMDAFWAGSVAPNVASKTKLPLLLLPLV